MILESLLLKESPDKSGLFLFTSVGENGNDDNVRVFFRPVAFAIPIFYWEKEIPVRRDWVALRTWGSLRPSRFPSQVLAITASLRIFLSHLKYLSTLTLKR